MSLSCYGEGGEQQRLGTKEGQGGATGALPPTSLQLPITCPSTKAVGGQGPNHDLGEQAACSLCTQHRTKGVNCEVINALIN